jgi:hypothetical protein
MNTALLALHSILRWVILILLIAAIIKSFSGWQNKKAFTGSDRKLWLFTLISSHTTFLVFPDRIDIHPCNSALAIQADCRQAVDSGNVGEISFEP